jgi:hypothetical protein
MVDYDTISSWDAKLQKETYEAHFYLQLAIDDNTEEKGIISYFNHVNPISFPKNPFNFCWFSSPFLKCHIQAASKWLGISKEYQSNLK